MHGLQLLDHRMKAPARCPRPTCHADLSDPTVPKSKPRSVKRQFSRAFRYTEPLPDDKPGLLDGCALWQCPDCGLEWQADLLTGRVVARY
jgi:hypothetical protein